MKVAEPSGTLSHVISEYSDIYVIDHFNVRYLAFKDGDTYHVESAMDLATPERLMPPYIQVLAVALAYERAPRSVLLLGLGGGSLCRCLAPAIPHATFTAIEHDAEVARLCREHFQVPSKPTLSIVVQDAYSYMTSAHPASFDVIYLDAYAGPERQLSDGLDDFVRSVARALTPGGVLAANVVPGLVDIDRLGAAVRQTFGWEDRYDAEGNVVVVTGHRPRSERELGTNADQIDQAAKLSCSVSDLLVRRLNAFENQTSD